MWGLFQLRMGRRPEYTLDRSPVRHRAVCQLIDDVPPLMSSQG